MKVLHVDYGDIEQVALENLNSLYPDVKRLPFQARPALLAGLDCSKKEKAVVAYLHKIINMVCLGFLV